MYSESSQDCVVLAFTGCQVNVLCSLPDQACRGPQMGKVIPLRALTSPPKLVQEVHCGGEAPQGMAGNCLDISQNAATINKAMTDIKDLAHAFAEIVRKYDY